MRVKLQRKVSMPTFGLTVKHLAIMLTAIFVSICGVVKAGDIVKFSDDILILQVETNFFGSALDETKLFQTVASTTCEIQCKKGVESCIRIMEQGGQSLATTRESCDKYYRLCIAGC